jgi:hypothetical protein
MPYLDIKTVLDHQCWCGDHNVTEWTGKPAFKVLNGGLQCERTKVLHPKGWLTPLSPRMKRYLNENKKTKYVRCAIQLRFAVGD